MITKVFKKTWYYWVDANDYINSVAYTFLITLPIALFIVILMFSALNEYIMGNGFDKEVFIYQMRLMIIPINMIVSATTWFGYLNKEYTKQKYIGVTPTINAELFFVQFFIVTLILGKYFTWTWANTAFYGLLIAFNILYDYFCSPDSEKKREKKYDKFLRDLNIPENYRKVNGQVFNKALKLSKQDLNQRILYIQTDEIFQKTLVFLNTLNVDKQEVIIDVQNNLYERINCLLDNYDKQPLSAQKELLAESLKMREEVNKKYQEFLES